MSPKPTPNDLTRQQLDELDVLLQRMLSLPAVGSPGGPPPPAPAFDLPPLPVGLPGGWRTDRGDAGARHLYSADDFAPAAVALAPAGAALELLPATGHQPQAGPVALAPADAGPPEDTRRFAPPTPDTGVPPSTATLRGADAPALPPGFRSAFAGTAADADVPALIEHAFASAPASTPPAAADAALTPADLLFPPVAPVPAEPPVPVLFWPVFAVNWLLEGLTGLFGPLGAAVRHPAGKHLLGACGVLLVAAAGAWSARGMGWVSLPFPR